MPITLPDLDTKSYQDIVDEMIASIPNYSDKWTNYNVSDPGITILEMVCWITEATLYRINKIPDASYVNFLRLLAGVSGIDDIDRLLADPNLFRSHRDILEFLLEIETGNETNIIDMKAAALTFLNSRYRAVTKEDFRELAIEATDSDLFYTGDLKDTVRLLVKLSDAKDHVSLFIYESFSSTMKGLLERFDKRRRLIWYFIFNCDSNAHFSKNPGKIFFIFFIFFRKSVDYIINTFCLKFSFIIIYVFYPYPSVQLTVDF